MKGLLLISVLCVSGSYARNVEFEVDGHVPDTVQWWIGDTEAWRIRTFGLDHDIHVYRVTNMSAEAAVANTRKSFADVTNRELWLRIANTRDAPAVVAALKQAELAPHFDVTDRFMFWRPDDAGYQSQTRPKD